MCYTNPVVAHDTTNNTHSWCVDLPLWYIVPPKYPKKADGQLKNGQQFCIKLQGDLKKTTFGMCTMNPTEACKPTREDTKADLIFKGMFCNYL